MKLFDIPYLPTHDNMWVLVIPGEGERHFVSRDIAIKVAAAYARKVTLTTSKRGLICLEGADEHWRLFDGDLKPVRQ